MSSLSQLKKRIQHLKKEPEESGAHSNSEKVSIPSVKPLSLRDDEDEELSPPSVSSGTSEIQDHPSWVARIKEKGNLPEDWLQYTNYVRDNVEFSNHQLRTEYLTNVYAKALKVIPTDDHKKNIAYAQLLINYILFKREDDPEEARSIMVMARINAKYFAMVHITAAQIEMEDGNREKARKILEKAQDLNVYPKELVETALKNVATGAHALMSQEDILKYDEQNRLSSHMRGTDSLRHLSQKDIESSEALLNTNNLSKLMSGNNTQELFPKRSGTTSLTHTALSDYLQPKQSGRQLDSSRTFVEPGIADARHLQRSILKKHKSHSAVLPRSHDDQCRGNLSPDSDDSVHGHLLAKAAPAKLPTSILNTPSYARGKLGDDSLDGSVVSFKPDTRNRNCSGGNSDENDTIPYITERKNPSAGRCLKSYHSTPDCKGAGILSSGAKNRPYRLPQRIRKTSPPPVDLNAVAEISGLCDISKDRKTSAGSDKDSGTFTSTHSMDHAILESSDEHKPMECVAEGTEQCQEPMDTSSSLLHDTDVLHQNISYTRSRASGAPQKSGNDSTRGAHAHSTSSSQASHASGSFDAQQRGAGSHAQVSSLTTERNQFQEPPRRDESSRPKPQQGAFATPCTKSQNKGQSLHDATPRSRVPLQVPMATPMGKQLDLLVIRQISYSILKTIGKGGSSTVYEVLDESNNLKAIKVVSMTDADDDTIDSYKNEIQLLMRLQKYSSRIIKMFDSEYQEDTKKLYVVMEKGETDLAALFKSRNKQGNITEGMRKFYWEEMLQAVRVLHEEGIVHSDLKPANFLLVAGHLKLIDFGIAKAIMPEHTSAIRDQQVGTMNYISPEAVNDLGTHTDDKGKLRPTIKIGVKSDVWSLGCLLYNMVYGKTPYHKIPNHQRLRALLNPDFVIDFPDIPDKDLLDVLKRCLNWHPKDRPSIDDLLSHPYITGKQRGVSALSEEMKQRILQQVATSSPRSAAAAVEDLFQQLQGGSNLHKSSEESLKTPGKSLTENSRGSVPRAPFQPHNY